MKRILVTLLCLAMSYSHAVSMGTMGFEHAREMTRQPDGNFAVVCIDGLSEVRTPQEVQVGDVCTHIQTLSGEWLLVEGGVNEGMRFCDLNVTRLVANERVLNLQMNFAEPCSGSTTTEDCNGAVCSARINDNYYTADFSTKGVLVLTRLIDGFSAVFNGEGGPVPPPAVRGLRITELRGVPQILQASLDGKVWKSVCDDSFDVRAAEVACRELGFSSVDSWGAMITVTGDRDYGLDDVVCTGFEESLFDCTHAPWGVSNCNAGEHVRLSCR